MENKKTFLHVEARGKETHLLFPLRVRVGFSWSKHKGAAQYRYQIVDLQTQESVKLTSTAKNCGFLPMDRNIAPTTYKIAVHAIGANEAVLETWQHFFHVGDRHVPLPAGEIAHIKQISFQPGIPRLSENKAEEQNSMRSVLSSPSHLFNSLKEPAEYMLSNRFFLSHNSNKLDHWMNAPLSRGFSNDLNHLIADPNLGFDGCDQELERDTFSQLNAYRMGQDLPQLIWNDNLARVARGRAFGHILSPGFSHNMLSIGGTLKGSLNRWGLNPQTGLRENIAWMRNNFEQHYTADDILHAWTDSPAHKENMLREARYLGIGVVRKKAGSMRGLEAVMISVL